VLMSREASGAMHLKAEIDKENKDKIIITE
jgi:hypothetical protein